MQRHLQQRTDLKTVTLSGARKDTPYSITRMWNLKKKGTYECIYKTEVRTTDVENKLVLKMGVEQEDKLGDWGICTLPHTGQITRTSCIAQGTLLNTL